MLWPCWMWWYSQPCTSDKYFQLDANKYESEVLICCKLIIQAMSNFLVTDSYLFLHNLGNYTTPKTKQLQEGRFEKRRCWWLPSYMVANEKWQQTIKYKLSLHVILNLPHFQVSAFLSHSFGLLALHPHWVTSCTSSLSPDVPFFSVLQSFHRSSFWCLSGFLAFLLASPVWSAK